MLCATVAGLQLVGDRFSLTMVFHNCGRNCGKKQIFRLRKPVTLFFTMFYHDNGYRPSGTCKAMGAKTFQRIRIV